MAKICLCLTGKTLAQNLELLEKYRRNIDMAELRADCLDLDERFFIRRFPALADIPVILTIRRGADGGKFYGGEGSRITLFCKALAFADADRRKNFAYIDLEEDINVPGIEEAARTFGTRIIRSFHNFDGVDEDLPARMKRLLHVGDEIPKAAVNPGGLADVLRIYQAANEMGSQERILLGMGHFGQNTRILAEKLGSFLAYCSAQEEDPAAPGQLDPVELEETYRFRKIGKNTMIFGITGYPLTATSSPPLFNRVYTEENMDAVYVPFPSDTLAGFMDLAKELDFRGASVTVPYKEEVIRWLTEQSDGVKSIRACNTIVAAPSGWKGFNTDGRGFSDSLLEFAGLKDLRGKKITIVGAGGVARAVASEIFRLKGKALVVNRTVVRAKRLADEWNFVWSDLVEGPDMMKKYQDIIIQTTSAGMDPDFEGDPLPDYVFTGKELVMDLVYKPAETRFLARAAQAGCRVRNGYDMLIRQAVYQYGFFMGTEFPAKILARIKKENYQ